MTKLTAVVLTYNEAQHIEACLSALAFADARLVFDSFSTDETMTLARRAGADVVQHRFEDYAHQRNAALEAVGEGWVLFVDAHERVTPALAVEVRAAIERADAVGHRIPRDNYIFGRLTRGAGWYPDYQTRLLQVGRAHYDPARQVHEVVLLDGPLGTLREPLVHHNYRDVRQFMDKQRRYTRYDARMLYEQGLPARARQLVLQPLRHFRWRFLTLGGWRDGLHGLRLSVLMAWYELQKYRELRRLWAENKNGAGSAPTPS